MALASYIANCPVFSQTTSIDEEFRLVPHISATNQKSIFLKKRFILQTETAGEDCNNLEFQVQTGHKTVISGLSVRALLQCGFTKALLVLYLLFKKLFENIYTILLPSMKTTVNCAWSSLISSFPSGAFPDLIFLSMFFKQQATLCCIEASRVWLLSVINRRNFRTTVCKAE